MFIAYSGSIYVTLDDIFIAYIGSIYVTFRDSKHGNKWICRLFFYDALSFILISGLQLFVVAYLRGILILLF